MKGLRRQWRDYNLSLVLLACFLVSWVLQAWTGWRKFAAGQLQHQQAPSVFGDGGYIWEFLAATFENWQSEFLQLLAMVVLTSFLIHRGSAESKDSNDRMESKLDEIDRRLSQLTERADTVIFEDAPGCTALCIPGTLKSSSRYAPASQTRSLKCRKTNRSLYQRTAPRRCRA